MTESIPPEESMPRNRLPVAIIFLKYSSPEAPPESSECFIEDQPFSPLYDLGLPPILPKASCLSFSVVLCRRWSLLTKEGGRG
jgi:hypothetical protein